MKIGRIESASTTIGTATVESFVLYQGTSYIQGKDVFQEKAGIPADGPGVVLSLNLSAEHTGESVLAVEVEGASEIPLFQFLKQFLAIGVEVFPGAVPSGPTPTAGPFDEEGVWQVWVLCKIAGLDMSYFRFVLVYFQGIVHELEEIGCYHQIVFQYDDLAILVYLSGHSIDNVSCQAPVLVSFHEGDLLEPLDGTDIVTYFVDRFLLGAVFGSIGIDEERTFGSQRVFQQAFNASAGMLGAIVNE